ncbi:HEAT repeat domain-containing protein [Candidatus Dependentiae bacterium]|nr:HEAT repeat domain-containing protein [Candidatus Dependentiae bacterium]
MEQSKVILAIKQIAASSDPEKIDKLQKIIKNRHYNDNIRAQCIIELGNLKSHISFRFLINQLKDPEETLKEEVVWSIGELKNPQAYNELKILLTDKDASADLRIATALALYNMGYKKEVETILNMLRNKYKRKKKPSKEIKPTFLEIENPIPYIEYKTYTVIILIGRITEEHIERLIQTINFLKAKNPEKKYYLDLSESDEFRLQQLKILFQYSQANPNFFNNVTFISNNEKIINLIKESGFFKTSPIIKELHHND